MIKPTWLLACVDAMRMVPWGPLDVIHLQDEKKRRMEELFDEYGDSYCEPTLRIKMNLVVVYTLLYFLCNYMLYKNLIKMLVISLLERD